MRRTEIWRKQDKKCFYCHEEIEYDAITADHLVPLKIKGFHTDDNIVVACQDCNTKKGHKLVIEFQPELNYPGLKEAIAAIRERSSRAEWKLSFDPKGSFKKWRKYNGR